MKKLFTLLIVLAALLVGCTKDQNGVEQITFPGFPTGEISLHPGESVQVQYSILPVSAQLTTAVEWSSSNPTVASVMNGTITANQMGRATITATAGGVSATLNVVVVEYDIESFQLSKSSIEMKIDTEETLTISSIVPVEASPHNIVWEAVPEGIISYYIEDYTLHISTISCGKTTLTGYVSSGFKQSCEIEVLSTDVARVEVTPADKEIFEGYSTTLTAQIVPDFALDKKLTWSVSPSDIGTITPNSSTLGATFNAKNDGTATITAKSANGIEGSCTIKVKSTDVTSVTLKADKTSIEEFAKNPITITATLLPDITPDKSLSWTISNSSYGTITPSQDGTSATFSPKNPGTVTITATAKSGVKATTSITVTPLSISNMKIFVDPYTSDVTGEEIELSPNGSFEISKKSVKFGFGGSSYVDISKLVSSSRYSWKSDKTSIATVDASGNVTAVGHGIANINLTYDGQYVGSVKILSYRAEHIVPVVSALNPKTQYSSGSSYITPTAVPYCVPYSNQRLYIYDKTALYDYEGNNLRYNKTFAERVGKYLTLKPKNASDFKNNWTAELSCSNGYCTPTHSITGWGEDKKDVAKTVVVTCTETSKTYDIEVKYNLAGIVVVCINGYGRKVMEISYDESVTMPESNYLTRSQASNIIRAYYIPKISMFTGDDWDTTGLEIATDWKHDKTSLGSTRLTIDSNGNWKWNGGTGIIPESGESMDLLCTEDDGARFPGRVLKIKMK